VELLGWSEAELRGEDVHDTLHHTTRDGQKRARSDSPLLTALASRAMAGSPAADVLWRKDGSPVPVQWSLRPMHGGLLLRGAVLTFTDLTEISRKEEALHRAVRVREEVVSVVSHDLRNPLGVVAAAADLLLDLPLDEPERRQQAEIIRRSAERMGRLVENLLDMARLEAGALVVRPAAQGALEILAEVEAYFGPQARDRGVALQVQVGRGVPLVLADPDRVQQALANLVANALKHSPEGGKVVLGAHEHPSGGVALTVRDEGPGIPAEDLPHLFDRFWQASRHDRTGTGLGLAIVRGIAEAHGGSVEVASELGKGALFSLVLPEGKP
jgi:PAS domain S-box-containing protein